MTERPGVLAPLEQKSSTLFLVAGFLLAVFAANTAARVFTDGGVAQIHGIVGPAGFAVGLAGLLGLYPGIADDGGTLARLAGIVAAIPFVGWFVTAVVGIGNVLGVLPDASVVLPGVAFVGVFLTTMLAFILFGVASLRTGAHSRSVGLVLLVPAIPFLTLILVVQAIPAVEWGEFVIDSGHALAHLAVGIALRGRLVPRSRTEPAPDATP